MLLYIRCTLFFCSLITILFIHIPGFSWFSSWPIFTTSNIVLLNVIELVDNGVYCNDYAKFLHLTFQFHNFVALITNLLPMFGLIEVEMKIRHESFRFTMTFLIVHLVLIQIESQIITLYQQLRLSSSQQSNEYNRLTQLKPKQHSI